MALLGGTLIFLSITTCGGYFPFCPPGRIQRTIIRYDYKISQWIVALEKMKNMNMDSLWYFILIVVVRCILPRGQNGKNGLHQSHYSKILKSPHALMYFMTSFQIRLIHYSSVHSLEKLGGFNLGLLIWPYWEWSLLHTWITKCISIIHIVVKLLICKLLKLYLWVLVYIQVAGPILSYSTAFSLGLFTLSLLVLLFTGDKCDVKHLEDSDFLYHVKETFASHGYTLTRFDHSVHLLTLKNWSTDDNTSLYILYY